LLTTGEDQPQVWRDLAVALRHAVAELADQVPQNPDQTAERPEVAAYEAAYQEKHRKARQQQRLGGGVEPSLIVQQGQQQGQGRQQGQWGVGGQGQQQQQSEGEEQEWLIQQEQLLAVIRRVSKQQQVELEHIVDIMQEQQGHAQQQQGTGHVPAHPQNWREKLQQRRQQLLHTWQQLQDRQVALLLARSKAAVRSMSGSSGNASGSDSSKVGAADSAAAGQGAVSSSSISNSSSSWSWAIAWLPFVSTVPAAGAQRSDA
jgi:hypothetical protein